MKSIFKHTVLNMVAILMVSYIFSGLNYQNDIPTLIAAATVLSLANAIIKPFLKILLLPINVITLGLTGWIVNVVILYITTHLVPGFQVSGFEFNLLGTQVVLSSFFAYIAISLGLSVTTTIIRWFID